ncbi:MAG: pyridoxamine 5'-phosphate oxidase family protein [Flavobacterium sp.]|nr:pyridoxamine 5'-phosphate oxidase family protein [Pedobacter sp.]
MEKNKKQDLEKIKKMVDEVKIAMLCTGNNNQFRSRPMSTAQFDDNGDIWFFTNEYSGKADEIVENHQVCLAYSNPSKNTYISLTGTAEIVNDWIKIKELYNPAIKAWFPEGLDDPKLALLRVTPVEAEYWDSSSSKMVTLFGIAKAIIVGEKFDDGNHGKVQL